MTIKTISILGTFIWITLSAIACDDPSGDLLLNYQSHATHAVSTVQDFREGEMTSSDVSAMQTAVGGHLKEMRTLREKMTEQCRQSNNCPNGGGATGEMHGAHMNGGHYLTSDQMEEMMSGEQRAEGTMHSMNNACNEQSEDVQTCYGEHADMMESAFDDIVQACSDMMSGHMDNREMMDGDAGMMGRGGM